MRFKGTLTSSILISALALGAAPALAADDRQDGSGDVSAALQRDLGLTPEQAKEQGPLQERAVKLEQELQASLGEGFAGSEYDLRSGRLIVFVSDKGLLEKAKDAGADPRLVAHSLRELNAIQSDLDTQAGGPKTPGEREASKPQATPFTSWYIDPASNSVHVTVTKRQARAAQEAAGQVRRRGHDRAVRGAPRTGRQLHGRRRRDQRRPRARPASTCATRRRARATC